MMDKLIACLSFVIDPCFLLCEPADDAPNSDQPTCADTPNERDVPSEFQCILSVDPRCL